MTINEIIKSIRAKVFEVYPSFEYPLTYMPQSMARPSVFIEHVRLISQKRMCKSVIMKTELYQLTYYAPTDEYYRPDRTGLYDVSDGICEIFSDGYLQAGGRAPKIIAASGGVSGREAFIDITVDRTEYTGVKKKDIIADRDGVKMKKIIIENGGDSFELT